MNTDTKNVAPGVSNIALDVLEEKLVEELITDITESLAGGKFKDTKINVKTIMKIAFISAIKADRSDFPGPTKKKIVMTVLDRLIKKTEQTDPDLYLLLLTMMPAASDMIDDMIDLSKGLYELNIKPFLQWCCGAIGFKKKHVVKN